MKILIVYAHPEPLSFNAALKDLAVEVLTARGMRSQVSDLYALKFNPAGGPIDFIDRDDAQLLPLPARADPRHGVGLFVPELKAEMDKLVWADFVIFQFPLWWFSLPAILKGWVDRVFAMGFSYSPRERPSRREFSAASAPCFPSLPEDRRRPTVPNGKNGDIDELLRHVQYGMLHFVGMDVLPPFIAYGAARVTPEQRAAYLAAYRRPAAEPGVTAPIEFERAAQAG